MATPILPEVFLDLPVANVSNPANFGMEANLRRIFKRCVECPNEVPSCPPCNKDKGEFCTQVFGGCNSCTENKCMTSAQAGGTITSTQNSGSSGPNVGAIVGGVLGGVAFIAVVTFLIWHFCIKNRKEDDAYPEEKDEYGPRSITDYAPSQHSQPSQSEDQTNRRASVRSVASSVMTRASNVIQIAFIPGITDRVGEDVPPVPQIPKHQIDQAQGNANTNGSAHSPRSPATGSNAGTPIAMSPYRDHSPGPTDAHSIADSQDHYFMPHDLQHSRYSQFSDETDTLADGRSTRYRSMASLAPSLARSSIASTHEPMPPMPAQKVIRGRAAVVSVKGSAGSAQSTPATSDAPPDSAGSGDFFKYGDVKKAQSESSGASTITKGEASDAITDMSGPTANPRTNQVAAAIEEATRRASARPTHGGLGSLNTRNGRDGSPRGLRPRPEGAGSPVSTRMRDASPMSANTREQSPMGTRPGTSNGRDVSPFSDKHAATPP